jgi:hypothetical protein
MIDDSRTTQAQRPGTHRLGRTRASRPRELITLAGIGGWELLVGVQRLNQGNVPSSSELFEDGLWIAESRRLLY